MIKELPSSRIDILLGILAMNVFFIGFCLVMWWTYQNYSAYLFDIVESQRALLVFQQQQTALLFVWVSILSVLIITNIQVTFVRLMKRGVPSTLVKVQKAAIWVMFLGVALAIFGNQLINPLWAQTFSEAGYSRCDTVVLRANKQFFNDAWVLNPADCFDPRLKQILHDDHSRRGFEKGARYLERKHQFMDSQNTARSKH